jgi:hypothetical protein
MAAFPELNPLNHGGKKLGDLEEELGTYTTSTAYLIAPKEYAVILRDDAGNPILDNKGKHKSKLKAKGVGIMRRDRMILDFDTIKAMDLQSLGREYHNSGISSKAVIDAPEDYFELRVAKKDVAVLCSQISRSWKVESSGFQLQQRFLIKILRGDSTQFENSEEPTNTP